MVDDDDILTQMLDDDYDEDDEPLSQADVGAAVALVAATLAVVSLVAWWVFAWR